MSCTPGQTPPVCRSRSSSALRLQPSPAAASEWGVFAMPRSIRLQESYQVRNLVADDPNANLWPASRSAEDIYANGIYVRMASPNEVQYLEFVQTDS